MHANDESNELCKYADILLMHDIVKCNILLSLIEICYLLLQMIYYIDMLNIV